MYDIYLPIVSSLILLIFFSKDPATTEIYTLSLHDALPISMKNINHTRSSISDDIRNILCSSANMRRAIPLILRYGSSHIGADRKSGSAGMPRPISYAVFCLKKKKSNNYSTVIERERTVRQSTEQQIPSLYAV